MNNGASDELYARNLVSWGLVLCLESRSRMANEVLHRILPYNAQKRDDGRFILLNRNYKPIGADRSIGHVDYSSEMFKPVSVSAFAVEPFGSMNGTPLYFFNDANPPWESKALAEEYVTRVEACLAIELDRDAPDFDRFSASKRYEKAFAASRARAAKRRS